MTDYLARFEAKAATLTTPQLRYLRDMIYVDKSPFSFEQGRIVDALLLARRDLEGDTPAVDGTDTHLEGENALEGIA